MAIVDKAKIIKNLEQGAERLSCAGFIQRLSTLERDTLFTEACFDRIHRKSQFIDRIFQETQDWNETFYRMLFRAIDISFNRGAYEELAKKIPYHIILRTGRTYKSVEALIFGTSGFLGTFDDNDDYIRTLKEEYNYLAHKFELSPMRVTMWTTKNVRPYNHPILRLSQLVGFLSREEFVMNNILDCRTVRDVEELFCVGASEFWCKHYATTPSDDAKIVSIGREKAHLLGINLVAQLQICYSRHNQNDDLSNRAISLLYALPAENNTYTRHWESHNIKSHNALESQALIQLSSEYCAHKRCDECPVAGFLLSHANK